MIAKTMFGKKKVPKGYRIIRVGWKLRRGDKYCDWGTWISTGWKPGTRFTRTIRKANGDYIRRSN